MALDHVGPVERRRAALFAAETTFGDAMDEQEMPEQRMDYFERMAALEAATKAFAIFAKELGQESPPLLREMDAALDECGERLNQELGLTDGENARHA